MPLKYRTIIGHLNSGQVKVRYSDFYAIQLFAIQVHTVFDNVKYQFVQQF